MLKRRIIPCLDVRAGRVVKGIQFQSLRDAGDPVELAINYDQQGADELVMLDVSATQEERLATAQTIEQVRRELTIPLTVGGGVRSIEDARRLLECGADKVSVNSAAVNDPSLVQKLSEHFGAQCTVVAIDAAAANGAWQVVTRSGTQRHDLNPIDWAIRCQSLGAGEILLTSWDRDGTGSGYDLKLIREMTELVRLPVIASGGAKSVEHMQQAFQHGAHAVLAATIFHDAATSVGDVKRALKQLDIEVRL